MFINYHTQMLQKNMLEAKLTDALVFSGVYFLLHISSSSTSSSSTYYNVIIYIIVFIFMNINLQVIVINQHE